MPKKKIDYPAILKPHRNDLLEAAIDMTECSLESLSEEIAGMDQPERNSFRDGKEFVTVILGFLRIGASKLAVDAMKKLYEDLSRKIEYEQCVPVLRNCIASYLEHYSKPHPKFARRPPRTIGTSMQFTYWPVWEEGDLSDITESTMDDARNSLRQTLRSLPLSKREFRIDKIIRKANEEGYAVDAPRILDDYAAMLDENEVPIDDSTLTTAVIPVLKERNELRNLPRIGYFYPEYFSREKPRPGG